MVSRLAELFTEAVRNNCQGEVAILFSGGLDSTAIAAVAKRFTTPLLITAGVEGSADLEAARKIAAELGLPHKEVVFSEEEIIKVYKKCYKIKRGGLLKVELMVPVFSCCREAARAGKWRVISGSGAEELFIGYDRYFRHKGRRLQKLQRCARVGRSRSTPEAAALSCAGRLGGASFDNFRHNRIHA